MYDNCYLAFLVITEEMEHALICANSNSSNSKIEGALNYNSYLQSNSKRWGMKIRTESGSSDQVLGRLDQWMVQCVNTAAVVRLPLCLHHYWSHCFQD